MTLLFIWQFWPIVRRTVAYKWMLQAGLLELVNKIAFTGGAMTVVIILAVSLDNFICCNKWIIRFFRRVVLIKYIVPTSAAL